MRKVRERERGRECVCRDGRKGREEEKGKERKGIGMTFSGSRAKKYSPPSIFAFQSERILRRSTVLPLRTDHISRLVCHDQWNSWFMMMMLLLLLRRWVNVSGTCSSIN